MSLKKKLQTNLVAFPKELPVSCGYTVLYLKVVSANEFSSY